MKVIPTVKMVLETYPKFAAIERMRMEKPCEKTVISAVSGTRRLCEIGSISLDEPITVFNRTCLERLLDMARCSKLKPISVWSYLYSFRKLFAKWTLRYYADKKWTLPHFEMPSCQRQSPRYVRPDSTVLAKVKDWYGRLENRNDPREWIIATLMLEFAMRNSDAERLRWSDFRIKEGRAVLCYTPHKTRLSSGRTVAWPVHPDIWDRL